MNKYIPSTFMYTPSTSWYIHYIFMPCKYMYIPINNCTYHVNYGTYTMYVCTYSSLLYPMAHIIQTQNDQWTEQMCFCTSNACKRLQKVCFWRPSLAAMWGVFKILPTLLVLASWTHWTGLVAWAELDGATTVGEVLPICANVDKWFLINLIPYVWPSNELIIFAT